MLELAELDIRAVIDELIRRRLVVNTAGFNARVPRYQHRFCNTEFGELKFSAQELDVYKRQPRAGEIMACWLIWETTPIWPIKCRFVRLTTPTFMLVEKVNT